MKIKPAILLGILSLAMTLIAGIIIFNVFDPFGDGRNTIFYYIIPFLIVMIVAQALLIFLVSKKFSNARNNPN